MMKWAAVLLTALAFGHFAFAEPDIDECTDGSDDPSCSLKWECKATLAQIKQKFDAELDQCSNYKSSASNCCQNPSACSTSGDSSLGGDTQQLMKMMMTVSAATLMAQSSPDQMASMSQICNMYGGMNTAGGNFNNSAANACSDAKQTCKSSCRGSDDHWRNVAICNADQHVKDYINQSIGQFTVATNRCDNLQASLIRQQANNMTGASNNGMSNVCNQLSQQQQQQLQPIAAPDMPDCTNPLMAQTQVCQVCGTDLTSPACQKAIVDSAGNNAGFQPASTGNSSPDNFNVGGPGTTGQLPQYADSQNSAANNPNALNPYGMMGGGGGGLGGASGSSPSIGSRDRGGSAGYPTQILHGERGGGGVTAGGSLEYDSSSGYSTDPGRSAPSLDLKNYLPGRQLYAGRKVAGVGSMNPDINAKTTDLFKRISDRFQVICSLNRLVDCVPRRIPNKSGF